MIDQMKGDLSDLVTPCRQCARPLTRCECCEECPKLRDENARLQKMNDRLIDEIQQYAAASNKYKSPPMVKTVFGVEFDKVFEALRAQGLLE